FAALRDQLQAAAEAFSADAAALAGILHGLVGDVERALGEPLEVFPVAHHSPSSALHMLRRLQARPPRAIYLECCEDLQACLELLPECKLPVALQAFASRAEAFPSAWAPLSVVCPITEFSAEQQVIAYCMQHPECELVFVDRSVDHWFQWKPQDDHALEADLPEEAQDDGDDAGLHGSALGVQIGALEPTFRQFSETLVKNARVAHFSEWWDQYVEEAAVDAGYQDYRQIYFLIGSLFRRLGSRDRDREEDEKRERFMWTRIKQHLQANSIDPRDAMYVCGANHTASYVPEFGSASGELWSIPERTDTKWLYGVLPSSFAAIEHQFAHPRGFLMLAERRWTQGVREGSLKPYRVSKPVKKPAKASKKAAKVKSVPSAPAQGDPEDAARLDALRTFLHEAPPALREDEAELARWSAGIVSAARKHGYLSTTADSIAIYQTATLLAHMRNRLRPSPYDFRDAAVTCLEKDSVPPGKRDINKLCDLLLGGDRVGQVGYESLPPLAKDVYDRLAVLPIKIDARTVQRALLDFDKHPEYVAASDLLWKLRYLLADDYSVRPIMGERVLGGKARQESWDIAIGKRQAGVIQLGYEGVTIEHVLERRLKRRAFAQSARCHDALEVVEASILYLKSERLTEELGVHAVKLLILEPDTHHARDIYRRISRLIHYYRAEQGLPEWVGRFVTTGYSHYCTLLPSAFADRGVSAEDLAAMLEFILTLESLALSLGCERSQFVIAIRQAAPEVDDATKLGLLWSVESVLQIIDFQELRARLERVFDNELTLKALPEYLSGFVLALAFAPVIARFTVELLSKAFERLPDHVLMPWLPKLIMTFQRHGQEGLPLLFREAGSLYPRGLDALEQWIPPWERQAKQQATATAPADPRSAAAWNLLKAFPEPLDAIAISLGVEGVWGESAPAEDASGSAKSADADPRISAARALLEAFPEALEAWATLKG
ncbi:MAG: DUF5682 family protein, partial [Polyangiaceae bacterium]